MVTKNNKEKRHEGFIGGEFSKRVRHGSLLVDEDRDTQALSHPGSGWIPLTREV